MTNYTLFQSGTGVASTPPASLVSFTSPFISGLIFGVSGGGNWFEGYWWYVVNSSQNLGPVKCALWSYAVYGTPTGQVVPGSVVTSGSLSVGWNWIPLAEPIQLAPTLDTNVSTNGSGYIAAIGAGSGSNWSFPDATTYWTNENSGHGLTSGPLHAYAGPLGSQYEAPYLIQQGVFNTGGNGDPSTNMPTQSNGTDWFGVDVQITTTAPSNYSGSYRLWPNKFDTNAFTLGDSNVNYTVGTEIHLSQTCTLDNIWYFSPAAAKTLATRCDVWSISSGLSVSSITSPSWLTAAGTSYTATNVASPPLGQGTWIKAAFPGGVTLGPGSYRVTIYNANGATDANWSPKDASTDYFGETLTGAGSQGITWGPLSAPNYANAAAGYLYGGPVGNNPPYSNGTVPHAQPVFGQLPSGAVDFPQLYAPVNTNESQNYWVDLEVTPQASSPTVEAVQWIAWDVLTSVDAEVMLAWTVGNGVQPNMSQMASVPWISTYPS